MIDPQHSQLQPGVWADELTALVALISERESKVERVATALDYVGSAVELLRNPTILNSCEQPDLLADDANASAVEVARSLVQGWIDRGLDARSMLDSSYPQSLRNVFDKPPLIFVSGCWDESRDEVAVAVVGTRNPTDEGVRRAGRLAKELVESGVTVLSGLAKGIDAAVHRGALDAGGRTVAVMGTGIDQRYPAENRGLADQIVAQGGALISQFLPDQGPRPWTFPKRNVTMSGLSTATIVVEASETSGTRIQSRVALRHGRRVFLTSAIVEAYPWARRLVEEGIDGARAIEISSTDDALGHLRESDVVMPVLA